MHGVALTRTNPITQFLNFELKKDSPISGAISLHADRKIFLWSYCKSNGFFGL